MPVDKVVVLNALFNLQGLLVPDELARPVEVTGAWVFALLGLVNGVGLMR